MRGSAQHRRTSAVILGIPVYADHRKEPYHQRAIEILAQESQVPMNEAAQLYENACAELAEVRKMLLQRSLGKRRAV